MGCKVVKALTGVVGKIPAEDKKQFAEIVAALIDQWDLKRPSDIMLANRLVSSWMKMKYMEGCLKKYGMFFEDTDEDGRTVRIRMNDMVNYLRNLEADVRSFYRLLNQAGNNEEEGPKDFMDWIDTNNDKTKKARPKKSKK